MSSRDLFLFSFDIYFVFVLCNYIFKRKKMERLNELQAIQKDLNENFEMVQKFL